MAINEFQIKTINNLPQVGSITNADEVEVQKSGEIRTKKGTVSQLLAPESTARANADTAIRNGAGLEADGSLAEFSSSYGLRNADFTAGITDNGGATGALTRNIRNALRILDARVNVVVNQTSTDIRTITVELSQSDILSLKTVPKTIISSAPDAFYEVISAVVHNEFGGTAYEAGTDDLVLRYKGGAHTVIATLPNSFIEAGAEQMAKMIPSGNHIIDQGDIELYCNTSPTSGNGLWFVSLTYRRYIP